MAFPLVGAMIALTAVQGVNQYLGQRGQERAVRRAGRYEGDVLDFNAAAAELQAADAIARGREAELRQRTAGRRMGGATRAALAAQGIDIDSGSALAVQAETQAASDADALAIRNNARREAYGFRVQAESSRLAARAARAGAANQAAALRTQAYGTLLDTGVSVGMQVYNRPRVPKKLPGSNVHGTPTGPNAPSGGTN